MGGNGGLVGVLSVESSSAKGGGVPQGLLGEGGVPEGLLREGGVPERLLGEGLLGKGGVPKGRSSCKRRKSFWVALRDERREGGSLVAVRGDRSSWRGRKASGRLSGGEEVVSEWLSGG